MMIRQTGSIKPTSVTGKLVTACTERETLMEQEVMPNSVQEPARNQRTSMMRILDIHNDARDSADDNIQLLKREGYKKENGKNAIHIWQDGKELWDNVLLNLQGEFGEAIYTSWFGHLKFIEQKENQVIVSAPSRFIREWVLSNYKQSIEAQIAALSGKASSVEIVVKPTRAKAAIKCIINDNFDAEQNERCDILDSNLDPRMTFDNFVVGDSNRAAYGVAKAIFEEQGKYHNKETTTSPSAGASDSKEAGIKRMGQPSLANMIYIQGSVGMGKTHLLQAIASLARTPSKHKKIAYLSADKFIHLYVKAIRTNSLIDFKEKLREADYLLIDDLQFICGKAGTQHELLNAVSAFTESNRKVIVTCDVSPYRLNLDKRAISKLSGGLVVSIKPSDYSLRLAILEAKAKNSDYQIPHEVLELVAKHITSSNRELEGALNKLITHCSLEGIEINMQSALEILKDNFDAHETCVTIESIVAAVADKYSVPVEDMLSKNRAARFVLPRQIAMYLTKQLTSHSLQEIGFKIGNRDHATVIYSVKKLEDTLMRNQVFANEVAKLMEHIIQGVTGSPPLPPREQTLRGRDKG